MIPSKVPVMGQDYSVDVVEGLEDEGLTHPHEFSIKLDNTLRSHPHALLKVLWHEIMHAYCFESGLHEILEPQACEQFCQTMSGLVISLTGGVIRDR